MRFLTAIVLCLSMGSAQAAKPLNFIIVLVDDMGWTDLGCNGSELYQTPNIDQLAKDGMRFTSAYAACTVCSPTRAAMMTGKYPARLHVTDWIHGHKRPNAKMSVPDWTHYLPLKQVTIAEALKKEGYATCHIGKWHLGEEKHHPDKQGFDHNIGGYHRGSPPSYFSPHRIPTLKDGPKGEYLTDREADEACRFIEASKDKPFFLYLPHYAVHTPLQGKKELIEMYKGKIKAGMKQRNPIFASMVHSVDQAMGKIRAKLKQAKVDDRTVIIFTSDNGGLVLKRRRGAPPTDNSPLRAGKGSTYEGGVRVPGIIHWPGVTAKGSVCHEPIMTIDYYPTVLAMAGATGSKAHNADMDGVSLVPLLKDASSKLNREAIYWHYPHYHPGGATPYGAVRSRDWKLIEFFEDNHVELYNLKSDISEKRNLAKTMPEKAAALRKQLHQWRKSVGAQMPNPNPKFKP